MAAVQVGYRFLLVISMLVSAGTALYVWRHRDRRGALPLSFVFASATLWGVAALVQTTWQSGAVTLATNKVILVSVVVQVLTFLLFALTYTGRDAYVTPRIVGVLSVEPLVFTALVWTNGAHELIWEATIDAAGNGGVEIVAKPLFWLHTAYSYGIMGLGIVLIVVFAFRSKYLYQRQATALVVATIAPWVANAFSLFVIGSYHLTPIAFAFTAVVLTWAVISEDFLDITPVATELILNTLDTAVFVVDDRDRIVDLNETAGELSAFDPDTVVGESIRTLLDDRSELLSVYDRLAAAEEPTTHETTIGDRYVRIEMSPLQERSDRLVGRAFMIVDLTTQREREEELRRRNDQLNQFAGVVSHDLRNPLEVASGSVQLALETGEFEQLERAERAHDRMDQLIEDILELARQDADSVDIETIDLAEAARESWQYVETADATLELTATETLDADGDRLGQLLENSFRNALEHGGNDVTVTVGPLPNETGFFVADDGPGFGDADMDSLFEAGYTTEDGGTGFGLSIVQEIATAHGWSVDATESEAGGAQLDIRTGFGEQQRR